MRDIAFVGENKGEKFTMETVAAYYQKQTAMQLERIAKALEETNKRDVRINESLERLQGEEATWRIALKLQQNRKEIESIFMFPTMPLSQFSRHLAGMRHIHEYYYMRGDTLEEAIAKTDYMAIESHGNGFRVRLLTYANQQEG